MHMTTHLHRSCPRIRSANSSICRPVALIHTKRVKLFGGPWCRHNGSDQAAVVVGPSN